MKRAILSSVVVGLALAGCTQDNSPKTISDSTPRIETPAEHATLTADTHFATGQLAESEHANNAAIKQYNEALKINPKYVPALYRLGVLYTELKDYPDAIASWHKYIDATNDSATGYSNLAFCLEQAGQPTEAEATYQQGIAKDRKNLACRTNYGLMLARHNHIQEAIRVWQPVLTDAEIHYNLASVYELDHRKMEAKAEYQKALELDPKLKDAQDRLASLDMN